MVTFASLFLISIALNMISAVSSYDSCHLTVSMINQDPAYAVPNDYVNVIFQVSGVQNQDCNGASFQLVPTYPFSLDSDSGMKTLSGSSWTPSGSNVWNIPYTIRVDKDALDGNSEIDVKYGSGNTGYDSFITEKFNITVKDSRTAFDAVIQQISGSQVSIAIANTGKYAANAMVVRVPDQDSFVATGTNGQMVGNLNSGDYTIVSFSLTQTSARNFTRSSSTSQTNQAPAGGYPLMNVSARPSQRANLSFDIAYTDDLGIRRTVNMQLPLNLGNSTRSAAGFAGRTTPAPSFFSKYKYIIILLILIICFIIYRKYKEQIKNLIGKRHNNKESSVSKIPTWVNNAREKSKK